MRLMMAIAGLAILLAGPAVAEAGDESVAEALACQAVRGAKARLRCFEAALPALRDAHPGAVALAATRAEVARLAAKENAEKDFGLSPAQQDETGDRIASANDFERDAFGESDLAGLAGDNDDEVEEVSAVAVEIGKNNRGKLFVVLDNGQVWRQNDGDSSSPYFPKNTEGLTVRIKKGALGSYFVKIGKSKDAFKASRIK